ncbi:MAG: molybdenum cofactor biosynthesis protein MoaE [Dehalococcoidia bacterium]|nr:molybdenum cofactor biosynthesis protein MoaE [Dehalococcoidia bacterium]
MILLTRKPLDPDAITATVHGDANGGIVTFLGATRNETAGRRVLYLEYEAYEDMAEKILARIAQEIKERWGITDVSIAHRFGRLEIGEVSLVVAVASPHRAEAFAACQYVVDRIKQDVPIWKKEFFENGEVWVGMEGHPRPLSVPR